MVNYLFNRAIRIAQTSKFNSPKSSLYLKLLLLLTKKVHYNLPICSIINSRAIQTTFFAPNSINQSPFPVCYTISIAIILTFKEQTCPNVIDVINE